MNKLLFGAVVLAASLPLAAPAQVSVSINIAPPPIPVYVQPPVPAAGYLWTPGYWRWSPVDNDYYWVPGTWVAPPFVGALWTPGYWGWGGGGYAWHGGYWGTRIGFYGGVNYGFGYVGHGYQGGYWNGGQFSYNRSVNNINTTIVRNVYNTTVVENNTRVSYNGGQGGIDARPSDDERAAIAERHVPPTAVQRQHEQVALRTPEQRVSMNHGTPAFAASPRPGNFGRPGAPGQAFHQGGRPVAQAGHEMTAQARPQYHAAPHVEAHGQPHGQPRGEPHAEPHAEPNGENRGGGEHREGGRER